MDLTISTISAMVRETLTRPKAAAARLLAMNVPDDARWLGFVIVIVLSVLLGQASVLMMEEGGFEGSLLFMAMFQTSALLAMVVAVHGIGRALGGTGAFPDALMLIAWLQFVMLVFQVVQLVALLVIPPLFGLISVAALVVFMWLLTHFIMALHGFVSPLKVAIGIIFSVFAIAMALAILLAMFGIGAGAV